MAILKRILPLLFLLALAWAQGAPVVAEDKPELTVKGTFEEKKENDPNLSGIDCVAPDDDDEQLCLLVDDELNLVQFAELDGLKLKVGKTLEIFGDDNEVADGNEVVGQPPGLSSEIPKPRCSKGTEQGDLDGEAVAHIKRIFYVVGSHGCSKNGLFRPQTFALARIELDKDGKAKRVTVSYRLSEAIAANARLAPFFATDLPPKADGTSIEAMAARDGKLIIGFRSPAEDEAVLLEVPIEGLFKDGGPLDTATIIDHSVPLGKEIGFRDLEALPKGGFVALTGPDRERKGKRNRPYALQRLTAAFEPIGPATEIDFKKDGSPEAIEILAGAPKDHIRVLVLSDGLANGGPDIIDIGK